MGQLESLLDLILEHLNIETTQMTTTEFIYFNFLILKNVKNLVDQDRLELLEQKLKNASQKKKGGGLELNLARPLLFQLPTFVHKKSKSQNKIRCVECREDGFSQMKDVGGETQEHRFYKYKEMQIEKQGLEYFTKEELNLKEILNFDYRIKMGGAGEQAMVA